MVPIPGMKKADAMARLLRRCWEGQAFTGSFFLVSV
jgi:hypothetical protein